MEVIIMFKYKSIKMQLVEERRKREKAQSDLQKTTADVDYIAMMCDVELETTDEVGGASDE